MNEFNGFLKLLYMVATYMDGVPFLVAGGVFGSFCPKNSMAFLRAALKVVAYICIALFFFLIVYYLIYPNYFAALESSIAKLGIIFNRGGSIYPDINDYSYRALPYGPLLTEIQSLFQFEQLSPILSSKIPGVLACLISFAVILKVIKNDICRYYLLLLLPFGSFLFSNRPDSYLLMLVVLTIYLLSKFNHKNYFLVIAIGALGGLAAAIKIHGLLYILAAIVLLNKDFIKQIKLIILFSISLAGILLLTFLPSQSSLIQFLFYLKLVSKHGLDFAMLIENLTYFLVICSPLFYIFIKKYAEKKLIFLGAIFFTAIGLVIAIIASKPGAGPHHLLPLIPIVGYGLQNFEFSKIASQKSQRVFGFAVLFLMIGPILISELHFFRAMTVHYREEKASATDLYEISQKYPGVLLAPTDTVNYHSILLNPILEKYSITQLDVPGYIDLNLSGVSDSVLSQKIQECQFKFIATPKLGVPFSISSGYFDRFLFSEELRNSFINSYQLLINHGNYSIYRCSKISGI
ncbi:hypothetical protein G6695_04960 [Polynucleobacter paneuropaeus]|nr:hypothetical protein [Polynucleobacter paneuropaeus]